MSSSTTFGASVVSQPDEKAAMLPATATDSPSLTPAISRDSATFTDNSPLPPQSPFYAHPPATHERVTSIHQTPAKAALNTNNEKNLEYGHLEDDENPFSKKYTVGSSNPECTMWPTHQTLRQTRLTDKKQRRQRRACGCGTIKHHWAGYSKNQRLMIRVLIALVVIGAIVGVAVGITRSVNGGVWSDNGTHDFDRGKGDGA